MTGNPEKKLADVGTLLVGGKLGGVLSRIFGGWALLQFLYAIYANSFLSAFVPVFEWYDQSVSAVFEHLRVTSAVDWFIELIVSRWDFDLSLQAHWKHIAVLCGLYFFREVRTNFDRGLIGTGVVNIILGAIVAIVTGMLGGSIQTGTVLTDWSIAATLIFGAMAYQWLGVIWDATVLREWYAEQTRSVPRTWFIHVITGFKRSLMRTIIGLVLALVVVNIATHLQAKNPGLVTVLILGLLFGIYWIVDGISHAKTIQKQGETDWQSFVRSAHVQLGFAMVGAYFYAIVASIIGSYSII